MHLQIECEFQHADGFELSVQMTSEARMTVVTGPSGSGKSTLLMLLAGLLAGARQRIQLGDEVVANSLAGVHWPPQRRGLGVAFQEPRLFPHLSVRRNLTYGDWRRTAEGMHSWSEIARRLEIEPLLDKRVGQLSGGQQQRLALGRAMLAARTMLVLDEPLTHVETGLRMGIASWIDEFSRESAIPVLAVTHNESLVAHWAGSCFRMDCGRLVATNAC